MKPHPPGKEISQFKQPNLYGDGRSTNYILIAVWNSLTALRIQSINTIVANNIHNPAKNTLKYWNNHKK